MPVASLEFTNLGPFDEVAFEFDPQVNVFIGPNNCGKTSALLALAHLLIQGFQLPGNRLRGESRYSMRLEDVPSDVREWKGSLPFGIGGRVERSREELLSALGYRTFVPALRLSTDFRSQGPTPLPKHSVGVPRESRLFVPGHGWTEVPPNVTERASWMRDEEGVQWMVDLDYAAYRQGNQALRAVIGSIAAVSSQITEGFPIAFLRIGQDSAGYYPEFRTPDGPLPLNVLSQGTQSLIQWCARLLIGYAEYFGFPDTLRDKPGVLIIDEIDAHLHPSWQRRILPTLTREFPSLQVFCATHSPLTLAGLKAGQIHLLRRDAKGKVSVSRNPADIQGWSADEIYANFLDVQPTDLATAEKLERVRQLRANEGGLRPAERQELETLREQLHGALRGALTPEQVQLLADSLKDAAKASSARRTASASPRTAKKSGPRSSPNALSKRPGSKR